VPDGGPPDNGSSTDSPSQTDGGACNPMAPTFPDKGCDSTREMVCQQWAQSVAKYGVSACLTPNGGYSYCGAPDGNGNGGCGTGPECLIGYVCASLTQGGPHQCVKACAGN
jgi:hypothetical protein